MNEPKVKWDEVEPLFQAESKSLVSFKVDKIPTNAQIRDWLKQTGGALRNEVRKRFGLVPLGEREHITYKGSLTVDQEYWIFLELNRDDHADD